MATDKGIYSKTTGLIDAQVVSGSTLDTFKLAIGQAWTLNEMGGLGSYVDTTDTGERVPPNVYSAASYGIGTESYTKYDAATEGTPLITGSGGDPIEKLITGQVMSSDKTLYNSYATAVRLHGNETKILSSEQWRHYCLGGHYGDITYGGILPDVGVQFACHKFTYNSPYTEKELAAMNSSPTDMDPYYNCLLYTSDAADDS